ncbi:serine hydrolase [Flagellimonas sp. S3867]|uniref:serine hydrolase domain-containing protein n=1 Tax=Flagellimonas sp. S3867 TaxID=2768063 RepID=UPI0016879B4D|nr:serine hydrolase [Flagellimonas sp. S3867]
MRTLFYLFFVTCFFACQQSDSETSPEDSEMPTEVIRDGLNIVSLQTAVKNAAESSNFYGLLVVKDEKVVVEEYFRGKEAGDLFPIRSITKNFTSALTGIAIEQGLINGLDYQIKDMYSELAGTSKEQITIGHLLNMSSGLQWNEEQEIEDLLGLNIQDPIGNLLSRDLESEPGATFNYNTLSPHVVTDIIAKISNGTFRDYAIENLLDPLGITSFEWETDPDGNAWGGVGLELRTHDLIKFGQLFLNNGMWNGQELIPEEWVTLSSTAQIDIPQSATKYSLQWYVADNLDRKVYFGQGFGGQALMLIPEDNMMIIAVQEYLVSFAQNNQQWNNFLEKVFPPIYQSIQ